LINGAGRLTDKEIKILKASIKKGAIQDTQIPIINYGDFIKFTQSQILELPRPYCVSMPLSQAQQLESKSHPLSTLGKSPLFKVRAGGNDQANIYLDILVRLGTESYGNWYRFQEEGAERLLVVDYYFYFGFDGDCHLYFDARFFGVKESAEGGSKKNSEISLDQRIKILNEFQIKDPAELKKALEFYNHNKEFLLKQ
ncbi:hypothetical protein HY498_01210, partial [Candidatus Woesearchaeota archaeon]|nr:hypothetical protein [Candidatus Woesearchaeota archaeon]